MRNIWLPRGDAQYVTAAQLKASGEQAVDRDPTFGLRQSLHAEGGEQEQEQEQEQLAERELDIQVPLLKVTSAHTSTSDLDM